MRFGRSHCIRPRFPAMRLRGEHVGLVGGSRHEWRRWTRSRRYLPCCWLGLVYKHEEIGRETTGGRQKEEGNKAYQCWLGTAIIGASTVVDSLLTSSTGLEITESAKRQTEMNGAINSMIIIAIIAKARH
jgi:hypothetical protein